jgi:deoxyribodipyrimidine photo-lyase
MIVASFLTKDLNISWQWGERYFMEKLLDGDLAPNNGGWQWAASTGCDPQPYFRIFNPLLQSQKFDPKGEYIKKYLPELRHLEENEIHDPSPLLRGSYPQKIVDHATQREETLLRYQKIAKRGKS